MPCSIKRKYSLIVVRAINLPRSNRLDQVDIPYLSRPQGLIRDTVLPGPPLLNGIRNLITRACTRSRTNLFLYFIWQLHQIGGHFLDFPAQDPCSPALQDCHIFLCSYLFKVLPCRCPVFCRCSFQPQDSCSGTLKLGLLTLVRPVGTVLFVAHPTHVLLRDIPGPVNTLLVILYYMIKIRGILAYSLLAYRTQSTLLSILWLLCSVCLEMEESEWECYRGEAL